MLFTKVICKKRILIIFIDLDAYYFKIVKPFKLQALEIYHYMKCILGIKEILQYYYIAHGMLSNSSTILYIY